MDKSDQRILAFANLWNFVPESWQAALAPCRQHIASIGEDLDRLRVQGSTILPEPTRVFAALETPPHDVRVIIIGQDPYPNAEHAIGLAFAVPCDTNPLPPTLRNILQELASDLKRSTSAEDLLSWPSKGVLLLNSALTLEEGRSGSHATIGWDKVLQNILATVANCNPDAVVILWGRYSQKVVSPHQFHNRIESAHPSPLSAYRGFFGSKPFSRTNELLLSSGQSPIDW
jgi:uracil-DNA glycosylase